MPKKQKARRLILLALGLLGLVGAWAGGLFDDLDADTLLNGLRAAGPWAGVAYVLSFAFLQAAGLSVYLFMITAMVLWSSPVALALSWLGAMGSATTGFWFARYFALDWVQGKVPLRFRHYDQRLADSGLRTVLIIRLLFFTTFWMNWLMGASKVSYRDYMIGTGLGNLPYMAAFIFLGATFKDLVATWSPSTWPWPAIVGVSVIVGLAGWWVWRRWRPPPAEDHL